MDKDAEGEVKDERPRSPVDRAYQSVMRELARLARLQEAERGSAGEGADDAVWEAEAGRFLRAVDRLVRFVASEDVAVWAEALVTLRRFGPWGIERLIAALQRTRDKRYRIRLMYTLGLLAADGPVSVLIALVDAAAEIDDEMQKEVLFTALRPFLSGRERRRRESAGTPDASNASPQ
jgi:hypothetical protein